jgi:hypothetical protein
VRLVSLTTQRLQLANDVTQSGGQYRSGASHNSCSGNGRAHPGVHQVTRDLPLLTSSHISAVRPKDRIARADTPDLPGLSISRSGKRHVGARRVDGEDGEGVGRNCARGQR